VHCSHRLLIITSTREFALRVWIRTQMHVGKSNCMDPWKPFCIMLFA